jgi:hypothetical protein
MLMRVNDHGREATVAGRTPSANISLHRPVWEQLSDEGLDADILLPGAEWYHNRTCLSRLRLLYARFKQNYSRCTFPVGINRLSADRLALRADTELRLKDFHDGARRAAGSGTTDEDI